jgi:ABC-2 type transport system ATP-binding protein
MMSGSKNVARAQETAKPLSPPIIVAKNLTKRFGSRLAVDDVSFSLDAGEVMGLLGPNGSGKSTILRMLVGTLRANEGEISIAGHDIVTSGRFARTNIGYVPENTPLYDSMRVTEFLQFMAGLKGLRKQQVDEALERVCDQLELNDVRRQPIHTLSHGFRQRVAIAQALLSSPPLIILDEPTNGLDPRQIIECRNLILSLAGKHSILVTSHILTEIEKIADRAGILLHGRLLAVEDLCNNPDAGDLESRFLALTAPH